RLAVSGRARPYAQRISSALREIEDEDQFPSANTTRAGTDGDAADAVSRMQSEAGPHRADGSPACGPQSGVPAFRNPGISGERREVPGADRRVVAREYPADLVSAEAARKNRADSRISRRESSGAAPPGKSEGAENAAGGEKHLHRAEDRTEGSSREDSEIPPGHRCGRSRRGQDAPDGGGGPRTRNGIQRVLVRFALAASGRRSYPAAHRARDAAQGADRKRSDGSGVCRAQPRQATPDSG